MKRLFACVLFLVPTMLFGQSAFNGTWLSNPQSGQFSGKPMSFSLKNDTYRCDTCAPKIEVPADGKDHKITGSPYADSISARVMDDRTIEVVGKKDGNVERTIKNTVSADGNTLIREVIYFPNGQEAHVKDVFARTSPAPPDAHKASGSWQQQKTENASDNIMKVTFKATSDELSMSDGIGDSYVAKFDGKDYPMKGDPGITSVALKKIDPKTIEETDKRDGKVIFVSRMTVSVDGQAMIIENSDKLHGTSSKYQAKKQ